MIFHTLPLKQALSLFNNGEMGRYIRVNVLSNLYYCGHWLEKMKVTVVLLLASLIGTYMGQQQAFDSEEIEGCFECAFHKKYFNSTNENAIIR